MSKWMLSVTIPLVAGVLVLSAPPPPEPPGKVLPEFIVQKYPLSTIAFSPDGNLLAVAGGQTEDQRSKKSAEAELTVWDLKARKKLRSFVGHEDWVDSVAFSPDGKTIASSSPDKTVRLWNVATGKEVSVLENRQWIRLLAFSPDGTALVGSIWPPGGPEDRDDDQPSGTVILWDVKERKERAKWETHAGTVLALAFSPDGKTLAASSGAWDKKARWYPQAEIKLWDPITGKVKQTLAGHKNSRITALAFSPDGKALATGATVRSGEELERWRGEVAVWNPATGKLAASCELHSRVDSVAFSGDGKLLAVGAVLFKENNEWPGEVAILNPSTLQPLTRLPGFTDEVHGLAFSPTRRLLAVPNGEKVKLWDLSEVK